MNITQEQVDELARLARLSLTPNERERAAGELERILACMQALDRLEVREEPEEAVSAVVLREDRVLASADRTELLAGAPETDGIYFITPQAVD